MHFHIITLFPGAFTAYLGESIVKRALLDKKIHVSFYNPRDYTSDPWRRVDRRPYGGGPGMVLEPVSVLKAARAAIGRKKPDTVTVLFFEPGGVQFDTTYAEHVSHTYKHVVMICGRYEGVDARVKYALHAEPITIGPYTLTGGELPAMVIIDCVTRRIPGVLGHELSIEERRVSSHDVYTRPPVIRWKKNMYSVPDVLRSGDHARIDSWKSGTRNENDDRDAKG